MLSGEPSKPVAFRQFRRERAWLEGGYIVAGERTEPYDPMLDKNLPNYFARVRTAEDACRFVERYGLLGRPRVDVPGMPPYDREPVEVVLRQAESVRMALRLAVALQDGDEQKAASILSSLGVAARARGVLESWRQDSGRAVVRLSGVIRRIDGPEEQVIELSGRRAYVYAAGDGIGLWASFDDESSPLIDAAYLLAAMVDSNLSEVRRSLRVEGADTSRPRLGFRYEVRSLIEAIWWHVSERAVTDQLRECLYCGTPFYVQDNRMKFCPPEYGQGQSACGDRYRKQQRRKKRERE